MVQGTRRVAESAWATAVIERDTKSHAPATGRAVEQDSFYLQGNKELVFALYDR
jgi:hypothetical protein